MNINRFIAFFLTIILYHKNKSELDSDLSVANYIFFISIFFGKIKFKIMDVTNTPATAIIVIGVRFATNIAKIC